MFSPCSTRNWRPFRASRLPPKKLQEDRSNPIFDYRPSRRDTMHIYSSTLCMSISFRISFATWETAAFFTALVSYNQKALCVVPYSAHFCTTTLGCCILRFKPLEDVQKRVTIDDVFTYAMRSFIRLRQVVATVLQDNRHLLLRWAEQILVQYLQLVEGAAGLDGEQVFEFDDQQVIKSAKISNSEIKACCSRSQQTNSSYSTWRMMRTKWSDVPRAELQSWIWRALAL